MSEQVPGADHSSSIAALAAALAKAQGMMAGAKKDRTNPHFKAAYADLASVWDACRDALSANGLAVVQQTSTQGKDVVISTMLCHSSGEWIRSRLVMPVAQPTPQGFGSALTYGRRYSLAAMVGVAPEDDDGNAATGRTAPAPSPPTQSAPTVGRRTTEVKAQIAARSARAEEEPPLPFDSDGPDGSPEPTISWGRNKGATAAELNDKELAYHADKLAQSIAEKPQFRNSDQPMMDAIQVEIRRRATR